MVLCACFDSTLPAAESTDDASWTHAAIQLVPLNEEFQTIWINPDQVEDLRIVAEFIRVLS